MNWYLMTFALQFIGFNGDLIGFYGDSDDQTEQKGDVKRTSTLGGDFRYCCGKSAFLVGKCSC